MDLVGVVALFFEAPFNGDLTGRRLFQNTPDVSNFWEFVEHMNGQSQFQSNKLVETGTTFTQLINRVSR
jgi:hypothetical protein